MSQRQDHDDPYDGERTPERDSAGGGAGARIRNQHLWVDLQIQQAMARGEFDDLPGAGKPIEGLGGQHDPDWWLKKMVEREKISVLPPALSLRREDLTLDTLLDRQAAEKQVRSVVEDFNRRIINARRQLEGGPPVITPLRDVEAEVAAWAARRTARRAAAAKRAGDVSATRRRWWRR